MAKVHKRVITTVVFLILIISLSVLVWKYQMFKRTYSDQPPYLELFLADLFYPPPKEFKLILPGGNFWADVSEENRRPIEWMMSTTQMEQLDSVYVGFKNTSSENMYFVTWGEPNSRLRINNVIYKNGQVDSIPFGGFGCGTGIYLEQLTPGKKTGRYMKNPLLFNPNTNERLSILSIDFPDRYRELYGDSVTIQFEQATYSLPWSPFPSQMIKSEKYTIITDKVIDSWRLKYEY